MTEQVMLSMLERHVDAPQCDQGEEVETVEQLIAAITADYQLLQALRRRLPGRIALAMRNGIPGRAIARLTGVPERNVRRWAKSCPATQDGPTTATATPGGALITPDKTRSNP